MNSEVPYKVKLTIEYDGTYYCGWQRQKSEVPSVQLKIEEYLSKLFGVKITAIAAGRTDAGVHALGQVVHFTPPRDIKRYNLPHAGASLLPRDISIRSAEMVGPDFHAQHMAKSKTYIYRIWNQPTASATRARQSLWIRKPLNAKRLNETAALLVGTHDFESFRSVGTDVNTTVRTINWAKWVRSDEYLEFHINGSGFLKQMVRNIVGTLLQIERNGDSPQRVSEILKARNRQVAGPTVAPQGLYLAEVFYPAELDFKSRPL